MTSKHSVLLPGFWSYSFLCSLYSALLVCKQHMKMGLPNQHLVYQAVADDLLLPTSVEGELYTECGVPAHVL